jgi:phosphotransferase system enzyme I (PtsI)
MKNNKTNPERPATGSGWKSAARPAGKAGGTAGERGRARAAGGPPAPAQRKSRDEIVFDGLGVSPGIAIGPAHVRETGAVEVPEYAITRSHVEAERARFADAVGRTRRQLRYLKGKVRGLPAATAEEIGYLLDAHLHMLVGSRLVRGVERRIAEDLMNAEAAVQAEISEIAKGFAAMDDPYLAARMEDIREVGARLVRSLVKSQRRAFTALPKGSVLIAEELSPADTALLDPRRIAGFATVLGGAEGHTAIMARALELPAVLGAPGLLAGVKSGDVIVVDGRAGRVVVNPRPSTLDEYGRRRELLRREQRQLARLRKLPAVTRDGVEINLFANVDLPRELEIVRQSGAAGVGLLRTEFLYMNRDDLPGEEEQYAALRDLVIAMDGRPTVARTLDVGGDKLAFSVAGHLSESVNPALGLRAIRLSLKVRRLLEVQLAAMLRAGAHGPLRILLPLISTPGEVRQVREVMRTVARRLKRRKVPIAEPLPPLGVMIETPGAALGADALAEVSDFFAIGTNDLTMYTLAIDRSDEQVAHLYNPLHPAVLRLIQFAVEAGHRAGIPVSVCGELAGNPRFSTLLLGLGVRDLSMAPANLPRVKRRIRGMDLAEAARRARVIMEQHDSGRIATLLDDFDELA